MVSFLVTETMTSGGIRTSVKGYLIAQRVTVALEISTVHDDEMSIHVASNSTAADPVDHPPQLSVPDTSASYGLNLCDGNIPCLPMFSSVAKGMASYVARTKSESPPNSVPSSPRTEVEILHSFPLRRFDFNELKTALVPSAPRTEVEILHSFPLRRFDFNELKTATGNFCPGSIMAQGGLGIVYKGWIDEYSFRDAKPGPDIEIVVKRLSQQRSLQSNKDWLTEVNFLGQLDHPNLVKLIGYCLEDGMGRLLVHEFIPEGSLNRRLYTSDSRYKQLSWRQCMNIALGAAKGLAFLHSNEAKVIYGDFETSKILLDSDYNAKLYGYGTAMERLQGYRSHVSEADVAMYEEKNCGVAADNVYAAPETLKAARDYLSFENHSTPKSDVYSYGVVLLEMLSGRRAFDNSRPLGERCLVQFAKSNSWQSDSAKFASKRKAPHIFDAHIDGLHSKDRALKALNLAIQCISMEPESRPNMNEVVEVLVQLLSSK